MSLSFENDVNDVVDDSEIIIEPLCDENLFETLIVPVAVQCIAKDKILRDALVFSFHDPDYENGVKGFMKHKLGMKFYFFSLGNCLNSDLGSYLDVYFSGVIRNIVLIRNRPMNHEISKDAEYRYFLKNVMENFAKFPMDWLFDVKFATIFTQEYNESLCILNEERHTFSYPKLVKVNSAKG